VERTGQGQGGVSVATAPPVDNELACLPLIGEKLPWFGPLFDRYYGATMRVVPSDQRTAAGRPLGRSVADIAGDWSASDGGQAHGLWGRAYFDLRGINQRRAQARR